MYEKEKAQIQARNRDIGGLGPQEVVEDPGQRTIAENLERKMQRCLDEYERLKAVKAKLGGNQPLLALTIGELRQAMDY